MTLLDHIKNVALAHHIPWELVHAICQVESSFQVVAMRYEPHYRWLVGDSLDPAERLGQKISWGPMQVMGAVAREYGFTGHFLELCTLPTGLTYGCLHLAKFKAQYEVWTDVIAAYNAGSPRRAPSGAYVNHVYVDKVLRAWDALDQHVHIKSTEA